MAAKALRKVSEKLGTLITYHSAVGGEWPTIADLHTRLRQFRRSDVVVRIAWCSALTNSWQTVRNNKSDSLLRDYMLPSWKERFSRWIAAFGEGFAFSRFTLLWLMRQALAVCPDEGRAITTREDLESLGEACLIANDLSAFVTPKPLPTELAVAANLLPNTEYFSQEDYDRDIGRTLHVLTDLAPRCAGTELPALAARIQELLGYTISEYCDLALASSMKSITADTSDPATFLIPSMRPENFATTALSMDTAERFLTSISADEYALSRSFVETCNHPSDLTSFRNWPLLRQGGEFIPLDSGFILDKAGKSLFWTALKNCTDSAERERILTNWGALFEFYVSELLTANLGPHSRFIASPEFDDGAQAFDGCVLEGNVLIALECKANTIKNTVRYADDPTTLEKILEERFIQGEGQGRKGLTQLSHSIRRFAEGKHLIERRTGTVVHPQTVGKIIPVLVHLDNALRTPGIPRFMANRFKSLGRVKRFAVTPLVLLPITELEEVEGQLNEHTFAEVLESFLSTLKADRAAVFFTRMLPILKGKPHKIGTTIQRFERYMDEMLVRLFPGEQGH